MLDNCRDGTQDLNVKKIFEARPEEQLEPSKARGCAVAAWSRRLDE